MTGSGRGPEAGGGPPRAAIEFFPVVYDELRELAARRLGRERRNHTLRPTELVHEVFLRLRKDPGLTVTDRAHFLAIAGRVMRRILVDHARRRAARKRGGGLLRITLDEIVEEGREDRSVEMLALDRALEKLAAVDPPAAEVVEHRFFGGLTEVEAARVMGRSERWVRGQWAFARAWLRRELAAEG